MITLVIGGQSSGKSAFVEDLLQYKKDVGYIATMKAEDQESQYRIKRHQDVRPGEWTTYEVYKDFDQSLKKHHYYIFEDLGNMLANFMDDYTRDLSDDEITLDLVEKIEEEFNDQIHKLVEFARGQEADVFIITNEVGMSLTPMSKLGRFYIDILGRANQLMSKCSDQVYLVIAGKGISIR